MKPFRPLVKPQKLFNTKEEEMISFSRLYISFFSRDAVSLSIVNCCTSVFAGLVVFSVLGHMSHKTNTPIEDVATSGKITDGFIEL